MNPQQQKQQYEQLKQLQQQINSNILFFIARSNNKNIVVYEFNTASSCETSKRINVYWLDIDPEYVKRNRAKGIMHDRVELSTYEKTMAYGCSTCKEVQSDKAGYRKFTISVISMPSKEFNVYWNEMRNKLKTRVEIKGQKKKLTLGSIFVRLGSGWFSIPSVQYVEIAAFDTKTDEWFSERLTK